MSLLATVLGHSAVAAAVRIIGLALLASIVTTIAAFIYRLRTRNKFPDGATVIVGLGVVAIYLNTRLIFIQFVGDTGDPLTIGEAAVNTAVFVMAGIASYGGRRLGDRAGQSNVSGGKWLKPNFSPIVRATGRFTTVVLPEEIADIEGYDPVEDETKAALKGRRLDFPRGLTVTELQSELAARLREKHDVGYVDIELTAKGTVAYLAVGQRAAGIGTTLPPNSAAVAIRADPPFSATPGDTVQLWQNGEDGEERLGTAELRASVGEVTTVATDERIAEKVDAETNYRLMTLSADSNPDREFAAMLRRGDETMSIIEIRDESPLIGSSVGALGVSIIAVRSPEGGVETIPERARTIQPGDHLFAIGRPDALRKIESSNDVQMVDSSDELTAATVSAIDWNTD